MGITYIHRWRRRRKKENKLEASKYCSSPPLQITLFVLSSSALLNWPFAYTSCCVCVCSLSSSGTILIKWIGICTPNKLVLSIEHALEWYCINIVATTICCLCVCLPLKTRRRRRRRGRRSRPYTTDAVWVDCATVKGHSQVHSFPLLRLQSTSCGGLPFY